MRAYVAFLRGINVNGRKILMNDLQKVFEKNGFENVRTCLASGNVLFDTDSKNEQLLRQNLEEALQKAFGFRIPVILRTIDEIYQLMQQNPFANIQVEKGSRLQITFFHESIYGKAPIEKEGFIIVSIGKREVASIVKSTGKTTDLMNLIDKTYGKNSTTRNWNTLQKLLE